MGVGDGTPLSPADVANPVGQAAERELRAQADEFVPAAQGVGASVEYDRRPGVHDWPYWRQYLKDAIAWGLFKPVRSSPRTWTFKTVERVSEAWGYKLTFAAAPTEVETFKRAGGLLRGRGSGLVTVRGRHGCVFTAKLPFNRPLCPRRAKARHRL